MHTGKMAAFLERQAKKEPPASPCGMLHGRLAGSPSKISRKTCRKLGKVGADLAEFPASFAGYLGRTAGQTAVKHAAGAGRRLFFCLSFQESCHFSSVHSRLDLGP